MELLFGQLFESDATAETYDSFCDLTHSDIEKRSTFDRYCAEYWPNINAKTREELWTTYSSMGFTCMHADGTTEHLRS